MTSLSWSMHESERYYITVKAENTVGFYVLATVEYKYFAKQPAQGVVYDVDPKEQRQVMFFHTSFFASVCFVFVFNSALNLSRVLFVG